MQFVSSPMMLNNRTPLIDNVQDEGTVFRANRPTAISKNADGDQFSDKPQ